MLRYLIAYFEKGKFDLEGILSVYDKFMKGEKPPYYMSDVEIRGRIEKIMSDLREQHYNGIFDFLKKRMKSIFGVK